MSVYEIATERNVVVVNIAENFIHFKFVIGAPNLEPLYDETQQFCFERAIARHGYDPAMKKQCSDLTLRGSPLCRITPRKRCSDGGREHSTVSSKALAIFVNQPSSRKLRDSTKVLPSWGNRCDGLVALVCQPDEYAESSRVGEHPAYIQRGRRARVDCCYKCQRWSFIVEARRRQAAEAEGRSSLG